MLEEYKNPRSKAVLYGKGLAMGVADIIPGVSGGTIAFISGIYEHLIASINSARPIHALHALNLLCFFWHAEKRNAALKYLSEIHWNFLLPLFAGIATAILSMAKVIPYLMREYPVSMYSLFFGLIVCSIPIVAKHMQKGPKSVAVLAVFAAGMFLLMGDAHKLQGSTELWYVFISGAIAICAMILPGISGSYILVLMGQYLLILDALKSRDLLIVGTFILGIAVGILSFTHLLKYLLKHYHSMTMAALTGIMVGSLRVIWPGNYVPEAGLSTPEFLGAGAIMLLGAGVLLLLNRATQALEDPDPPMSSRAHTA
jgi:putative membrane protein